MQYEEKGWPKSLWELTAPESAVLISGPQTDLLLSGLQTDGIWHFELALMELVAGKHLSLIKSEDRSAFGLRKRRVTLLVSGPERRSLEGRSLSALLELFDGTPTRTARDGNTGVPVTRFARRALREYGWFGGYVEAEVMPGLVDRGLYEQRRERRRFSKPQWRLSRAGEDARAELGRILTLGEERFGPWVDEDPTRALAFLGVVGSSFLLIDGIYPNVMRLRERLCAESDVCSGMNLYSDADGGPGLDDPGAGWQNAFVGLDLDAFDIDLGAFYGQGSALVGMAAAGGNGGGP